MLSNCSNLQIRRPEVISPLTNAMGFINSQQIDLHSFDSLTCQFSLQPFGAEVQQLIRAIAGVFQYNVQFPLTHACRNCSRWYATFFQLANLVFHQGNQGRHHQTKSILAKSRHLVAYWLATASGQKRERILAIQCRLDDRFLLRAECSVPPELS